MDFGRNKKKHSLNMGIHKMWNIKSGFHCMLIIFHWCASCCAHLINLHLITMIVVGGKNKLWYASLCHFLWLYLLFVYCRGSFEVFLTFIASVKNTYTSNRIATVTESLFSLNIFIINYIVAIITVISLCASLSGMVK
jgi:hypothetical protein